MHTIYGIWASDVESPALVTMMFDGKLAQRLADETWDIIQRDPYDPEDKELEFLTSLHGLSDEQIGAGLEAHQARITAWRSKLPLYPYAPEFLFESFVTDGFGVGPVRVHGTPQYDYLDARVAIQRDAWHQVQTAGRSDPYTSHVLTETEMHRRLSSFQRVLSFLSRR